MCECTSYYIHDLCRACTCLGVGVYVHMRLCDV